MDNLLQLREDFSRRGILISFNGSLSNSIIEEIGNAIKRYLEDEQREKGIITDVFAVYVEQTQNMRNYVRKNEIDEEHRSSILVISTAEGHYKISSGNCIKKTNVPSLTSHLEQINSLDKDGLKQMYKEQRRKVRTPDMTSAGLGLIDIARRASSKISYQFDRLDDEYDFFSLTITIQGA